MKYFWLIVTIVALIILLVTGYNKTTAFNVDSDKLARVSYYGIFGLVAASALLSSGIKLSQVMRNTAIWLAIIFALMCGYSIRYDIQDFASRVTAGIIPGSPVTRYSENGRTVNLERSNNGHFQTRAIVNGQSLLLTVDTGASSVVLSYEDAKSANVDVDKLSFTLPVDTANGSTQAAFIMLNSIKIGDIERQNVRAMVSKPGDLTGSLLGMTFLDRLSGYSVRGDRLILVD